jgi:hypothetical protein
MSTKTETSSAPPKTEFRFDLPLELWLKELAVMEEAALARARETTKQIAKLAGDTIDYYAQLSAEWRKMMIDVARRTGDMTVPKA